MTHILNTNASTVQSGILQSNCGAWLPTQSDQLPYNRDLFQSCHWTSEHFAEMGWPDHGIMVTLGLAPAGGIERVSRFNAFAGHAIGKTCRLVKHIYNETVHSKHAYKRGEQSTPCLIVPEKRSKSTGREIPMHIHAIFSTDDSDEILRFQANEGRFRSKLANALSNRSGAQATHRHLAIDIQTVRPAEVSNTVRYCTKFAFEMLGETCGTLPDGTALT
ncbi:hypothetical protein [Maricaulis sp.]|uniref:hypothetical protein n=1 Tax=Maricaulis sp. TaxID=1486257 RepID=UPI003A9528DE